jgi:hypothetical protein
MQKTGLKLEQEFSRQFHSQGVPVLVSPALLRERQLGQLDLVSLNKTRGGWILEVGEVKSSMLGLENMQRAQLNRIRCAQNFLAGIFGVHTRLQRLHLERNINS